MNPSINNATTIHTGDTTHHHDQSMTWHNLRAMKVIVNKPTKPIPDDEDDEDDLLIVYDFLSDSIGSIAS
jgi:hypothetical protein